jgi:hypothetical protein
MSAFPITPNPRKPPDRPPDRPPDQAQNNQPGEFVRFMSEFPHIQGQTSGQPHVEQPRGQPSEQPQHQLDVTRANPVHQQTAGQQHHNQGYNYPMNPGIPPGFPSFGYPGFGGFGYGPYPFFGGFPGQMGGPNPPLNNQPYRSQPQGSSTQEVQQLGKDTSLLISIPLECLLAHL